MTDSVILRIAAFFLFDVGRLAVWLVLLVAIFVPMERLCALHPAKIWRKQIGVDLGWYFINSLIPAIVFAYPIAFISHLLHMVDPGGFYSYMSSLPVWVRLLPILVLTDFGAYWGHRALHSFGWMWRFHSIHHSAEQMDWLVNTRAHPFDIVFMRLTGLTPIYLLGLAETSKRNMDPAVALVTVIITIWNFFIHSNVRFRLGPFEKLISSPVFHHWHHCNDRHRNSNFAFIFPFIDRIFGTAWTPGRWPDGYGIDKEIPPTLSGQFLEPILPATDDFTKK